MKVESMENFDLDKAQKIIELVQGKPLSMEERADMASLLAKEILEASQKCKTHQEKRLEKELHEMMVQPLGKVFVTEVTDQAFRSSDNSRSAEQLIYLLNHYGIPKFLSFGKKIGLYAFKLFGSAFPNILVPLAKKMLRREASHVVLPYENLNKHLKKRIDESIHVNLNHLGEAILGEDEAKRRLFEYVEDLKDPGIECISIKISTILSQINLLAWDQSLSLLKERLRLLYRTAKQSSFTDAQGNSHPKFVYLDMEEFKDLHLTAALFKEVLSEEEFLNFEAGIVLQSYVPDSFAIQKELTEFANERVEKGGSPIKIRLVKGANMALEEFESAIQGWAKAPYATKLETDANFKKMLLYGVSHVKSVRLGIGSHNIFDIALGLIMRSETNSEPFIGFEMLEGMSEPVRKVVSKLSNDMLLYCPTASKKGFVNAIAYLVRRLDENTDKDNFLKEMFGLKPGSPSWNHQEMLFRKSLDYSKEVSEASRRGIKETAEKKGFQNEPNTDWTVRKNRERAQKEIDCFSKQGMLKIASVIDSKEVYEGREIKYGFDPSKPAEKAYAYSLTNEQDISQAMQAAKKGQKSWAALSEREREGILKKAAEGFRKNRGRLLAAMQKDVGKPITESDPEISEAIDFIEYYLQSRKNWLSLPDVEFEPCGTFLVVSPWNFPCAIPVSGIAASLVCQNSVIFKPAPESILTGYELAKIFWEAGVPKEVLQFVVCEDHPVGTKLVSDPELAGVLLTGSTETAKYFLSLRNGMGVVAESGGKNVIIVSSLADRDLAVKDIVHSAFNFAGQKCSACSLVILEKSLYDDPDFLRQLKDAAKSLATGSAYDHWNKVPPLIHPPSDKIIRAMKLEKGESWLLEPFQDPLNPRILSPGIKLGVKPGSYTYETELFGPILGLMRAEDFDEALLIGNALPYGLTAGLESLDSREQEKWRKKIEAGNLYINRSITGAVVQRQPFGGCKASSFGPGIKVGGPNFLTVLTSPKEKNRDSIKPFDSEFLRGIDWSYFTKEEKKQIEQAACSYTTFWKEYFSQIHDPTQIKGQDNNLGYVPKNDRVVRFQNHDPLSYLVMCFAADLICQSKTRFSLPKSFEEKINKIFKPHLLKKKHLSFEDEEDFISSFEGKPRKVRLLSQPLNNFLEFLTTQGFDILLQKPLSNGRLELLCYLREEAMSFDYHRYGNLGAREGEK